MKIDRVQDSVAVLHANEVNKNAASFEIQIPKSDIKVLPIKVKAARDARI